MDDEGAALKKFIVQRLERFGKISVQNLTGHLSQLPFKARDSVGSKQELLAYLRQHSSTFTIDSAGYVKLAAVDSDHRTRRDSGSSVSSSKSQDGKFPPSITNGKGKVVRIFNNFGFIKAEEPFKTTVYFNAAAFGDKSKALLKDCAVYMDQKVCFNAKLAPSECDSKYSATKVWPSVSDENSNNGVIPPGEQVISKRKLRTKIENGLYDPCKCEGEGPIQNIFPKYGFVAIEGNPKNTIFFCARNIRNYKNIVDLTEVLSNGDLVEYSAIRSTKPDANVRWEATEIFVKKTKKKISISNDSDDETFTSGPPSSGKNNEVESRVYYNKKLMHCNKTPESPRDGKNPTKCTTPPVRHGSSSSSAVSVGVAACTPPEVVCDCTGKMYVRPLNTAVIKFGKGNREMATVDVSVVYVYGTNATELAWEFDDGHTVFFDAKKTAEPPGWEATLVWVGSKPENVGKTNKAIKSPVHVSNKLQSTPKTSDIERDVSSENTRPEVMSEASVSVPFETYTNWADAPYSEEEEEQEEQNLTNGATGESPKELSHKEEGFPRTPEFVSDSLNSRDVLCKKDIRNSDKPGEYFEKGFDIADSVDEFVYTERKPTVPDQSVEGNPSKRIPVPSLNSGVPSEEKMKDCDDDEDSDNNSVRFFSDSEDEAVSSAIDDRKQDDNCTTQIPLAGNAANTVQRADRSPSTTKIADTVPNVTKSVDTTRSPSYEHQGKESPTNLTAMKSDSLSASVQNVAGWSSRIEKNSSASDVSNSADTNVGCTDPCTSVIYELPGLCGHIKVLRSHYGEVTCEKLRKPVITFYAKDFYVDEKPMHENYASLEEVLKVGDVVYMNCFEIVDDKGMIWQKVTLIWKGKKPKGCKEMSPKDLIEQLNLKVSCLHSPEKPQTHTSGRQAVRGSPKKRGKMAKHIKNSPSETVRYSSSRSSSRESSNSLSQPDTAVTKNSSSVTELLQNTAVKSLHFGSASSKVSSNESLNSSLQSDSKASGFPEHPDTQVMSKDDESVSPPPLFVAKVKCSESLNFPVQSDSKVKQDSSEASGIPAHPDSQVRCKNEESISPPAFPPFASQVKCKDEESVSPPAFPSFSSQVKCKDEESISPPAFPPYASQVKCKDEESISPPAFPPFASQVKCKDEECISPPPPFASQVKCSDAGCTSPLGLLQRGALENLPLQWQQFFQKLNVLLEHTHTHGNASGEINLSQAFKDSISSEIAKLIDRPVCSRCSCRKEVCDQMVQTEETVIGSYSVTETEVKKAYPSSALQPPCMTSKAVQTFSSGDILSVDIYPQ